MLALGHAGDLPVWGAFLVHTPSKAPGHLDSPPRRRATRRINGSLRGIPAGRRALFFRSASRLGPGFSLV